MVSQAIIDIVGYIGTGVACLLIAAQVPAMVLVARGQRSMNDLSAWPTVGQAANFLAWCVYALVQGDLNLLRVNVIGVVFSCGYAAMFLLYASGAPRQTFLRLLAAFALVNGGVFAAVLAPPGLTTATRVQLLGYYAVSANVAMYAFPIAALRAALKSMDPSAIPLLLTLAGSACSCNWLLYGLLVDNWFVAGPNAAGVALNAVQLLMCAYVNWQAASGRVRLSDAQDEEEYARLAVADKLEI